MEPGIDPILCQGTSSPMEPGIVPGLSQGTSPLMASGISQIPEGRGPGLSQGNSLGDTIPYSPRHG